MAISTPVLRHGSTVSATTITSVSFTPAASSTLIAIVGSRIGAAASSVAITLTDSLGGSWSLVRAQSVADGTTAPSARLAVFKRDIGASPAAMTVTGSHSEAARLTMHVFDFTGADATITNTGADVDNTGDVTATISAPSVASLILAAAFFTGSDPPVSPLTVQLAETLIATQAAVLETSYTLTSGPSSAAWNTTNLRCGVQLIEIPVAPTVMTGAGTTGIVGAAEGVQGNVITGAGTIAPVVGLGDLSVDANLVGEGVLAPLTGAGVVSVGIGIVGAGLLDAVVGQGLVEFTPLPPPDTLTLVIWSRCDRCGLRCRPADLAREPDTGLWLHPHCMDDVRSLRRPRRPVTRFRNPRPDTELETNR